MGTLYRPIVTREQVSAVIAAGTVETLHVEFKKDAPAGTSQRETALDIAAFANQWVGTILYGIKEIPGGGPHDPCGVRSFEKVREHIEVARKNSCRPTPNAQCERFEIQGAVIMAVNVPADERVIAVPENDLLAYPFRTNQGKSYMSAEQVIERATPSTRLGEIKLHRALGAHGPIEPAVGGASGVLRPSECQVRLTACYQATPVSGGVERINRIRPFSVIVENLDDFQFCLRIVLNQVRGQTANPDRIWIPYGLVREAWPMTNAIGLALAGKLVYDGGWHLDT